MDSRLCASLQDREIMKDVQYLTKREKEK
jgi:hypothetical protein